MLEIMTLATDTFFTGDSLNPAFYKLAEERIAIKTHQGRNTARQVESANLSTLPKKTAQNAPKPLKKAEKEGS